MKASIFTLMIVTILCISQNILAYEIYQDADGVWRNRETPKSSPVTGSVESVTRDATKSYIGTMAKPSTTSNEIYQDKDGVWRNRDVQTNSNLISDGVQGFTKGFAEGTAGAMSELGVFQSNHPAPTTSYMKEHNARVQHRKNMRFYEELNESKRNFEGYEKFDPSKAGEVKSEWEFFNDPR